MIKNIFVFLNSNSSILKLNFGLLILFANLSQIPALFNILGKSTSGEILYENKSSTFFGFQWLYQAVRKCVLTLSIVFF